MDNLLMLEDGMILEKSLLWVSVVAARLVNPTRYIDPFYKAHYTRPI
jgi:hypothetical protein